MKDFRRYPEENRKHLEDAGYKYVDSCMGVELTLIFILVILISWLWRVIKNGLERKVSVGSYYREEASTHCNSFGVHVDKKNLCIDLCLYWWRSSGKWSHPPRGSHSNPRSNWEKKDGTNNGLQWSLCPSLTKLAYRVVVRRFLLIFFMDFDQFKTCVFPLRIIPLISFC